MPVAYFIVLTGPGPTDSDRPSVPGRLAAAMAVGAQ
jgi:hypothetical protein